jgi:hypothetical protein
MLVSHHRVFLFRPTLFAAASHPEG